MFEKLRRLFTSAMPPDVVVDPQIFARKIDALFKACTTHAPTPEEAKRGEHKIGTTHLRTIAEAAYRTGIPERWFTDALNAQITTVPQRRLDALQGEFDIDADYWQRLPLTHDPDYPRYCAAYLAYLFEHYRTPDGHPYRVAEIDATTRQTPAAGIIVRVQQGLEYLTYAQRHAITDAFEVTPKFWSHALGTRNFRQNDPRPDDDDVTSRILCIRGMPDNPQSQRETLTVVAGIIAEIEQMFSTQEWREHDEAAADEAVAAQLQRWKRQQGDDPKQIEITNRFIALLIENRTIMDNWPIRTLAARGYYAAVPPVVSLLDRETDITVRIAMITALGQLRDRRALPALYQLSMTDATMSERVTVRWAIDQIERKGEYTSQQQDGL